MGGFQIVPLEGGLRGWARDLIGRRWASPEVVTRGRVHDAPSLPGFVALGEGRPVGVVTYDIRGGECEVVSLDSLAEGRGIGSVLIKAVCEAARRSGCKRVWLITTNDNIAAVRFYQRRGFHIRAIHLDALEESRRLKPEIPLTGLEGIPLTDEIEMDLCL
jgi:ribosomal protein S18 acetylase RimI-like enzyme